MSDPSNGASVSTTNQCAIGVPPNSRPTRPSRPAAKAITGFEAAMTMMTKTKRGSMNLEGPSAAVATYSPLST